MALSGGQPDIIEFNGVGHRADGARTRCQAYRLMLQAPVADRFNRCFRKKVQGLFGFGKTWAFPAARRLAGEGADCLDRISNRFLLIFNLMHGALDEAVPDETPTSVEGGLTCSFVDLERGPIDREACLQAA